MPGHDYLIREFHLSGSPAGEVEIENAVNTLTHERENYTPYRVIETIFKPNPREGRGTLLMVFEREHKMARELPEIQVF